ncbi:MAG: hypothetical protein WCN98_02425 [Verrucomicrobiaceae bacterium]
MTDSYIWATQFHALFESCVEKYKNGSTGHESWFSADDMEFLKSIGCRPRELFDFVEDHVNAAGGEPGAETALLVAAVRRDYFRVEQMGVPSSRTIKPSELPAKTAELDGIVWLPRIIAKAEAKLRGEMDLDTMFGCGGDRAFLSRHHLHPADFLRVVWAARGDSGKVLEFVKTSGHT